MPERSIPTVSVVMAVYNGERFLRAALDSILAQTFTDFELIVVDDGSTDSTASILDSYLDPRIVRIKNTTNIGLTHSLNVGLKKAKGKYIARHDADDISYLDRFRQQVVFLESHPDVGFLGTGYQIIDRYGSVLETILPPIENTTLQTRLEHQNCFCHGSVMIRRGLLEKVNGYREFFPVTQDYDLWLRLAERSEVANLSYPLYQFRFDGSTVSRQKTDLQLAYDKLARVLAIQRRSTGIEEVIPENILDTYAPEVIKSCGNARWAAYLFYVSGQFSQANESLIRAYRAIPDYEKVTPTWQAWILSRARAIAHLHNSVDVGNEFITWCLNTLPLNRNSKLVKQISSSFYVDQAFLAFNKGLNREVIACVWQAIRQNRHWFRNRGLWVITGKSLLQLIKRNNTWQ